jgi:hypothetical protein
MNRREFSRILAGTVAAWMAQIRPAAPAPRIMARKDWGWRSP